MKSRKLKAVLAAVSALAVLATAMTGFAAIDTTTTTIYNTADAGKGTVEVDVTGLTPNSEVTYLVKSEGAGVNDTDIVYIDQATAKEDGTAEFNYKIAHSAINSAYGTVITMGSDTDEMTGYDTTLGITALNDVTDGEGYKILFAENAYANGDTVNVSIEATDGYVIDSIEIAGEAKDVNTLTYAVPAAQIGTIKVTAAIEEKTPQITTSTTVIDDNFDKFSDFDADFLEKNADKVINTTLMHVDGTAYQVGVKYNGQLYPAAHKTGYVAVILLSDGESVSATPYYIANEGEEAIDYVVSGN